MKNLKILIFLMLSLSLTLVAAAQSKKKIVKKTKTIKKTVIKTPVSNNPAMEDYKILAEGSNAKIEKPFIFIARDAETYAHLQRLVEDLPPPAEIDFNQTAVVAAFAGMKNTGGYTVKIGRSGERSKVELLSPPPDAMVTEALTAPFKVALVPVEAEKPLMLDVSGNWSAAMQTYKIASSEFEYAGGFRPVMKKFAAEGTINFWQAGELVTLDFDLSGKGTEKERKLGEIASGAIKTGKIYLARLDAGSFSENPKPPVKATGTLNGDRLSLTFEPLPTNVNDGFEAKGRLEAVKVR